MIAIPLLRACRDCSRPAPVRPDLLSLLAVLTSAIALSGCERGPGEPIPYDATHSVIYDNDGTEDVYTDELLLGLHAAGQIQLRGLVTTVGGWADTWNTNPMLSAHLVATREELVAKARRAGLRSVPAPVAGVLQQLVRPASGVLRDTEPHGTEGTRLLVAEARRATPAKPLVVIVGGPASTIADAYLLDPSIADRVIVAWNGVDNFNGYPAPFLWATEIVLRHFTCVLFDRVLEETAPRVDKSRLAQLPPSELQRYMVDKELPHVNLPGGRDVDAQPVIALIDPTYVRRVQRLRWAGLDERQRPAFAPDEAGNIWRVVSASRRTAERVWWRTITGLAAQANQAPQSTPYHGTSIAIPGRIEAEHFDHGGPGVAYADSDLKSFSQNLTRPTGIFRVLEHVDFGNTDSAGSSQWVTETEPGEWLGYSVQAAHSGRYRLQARVQPGADVGSFRVAFARGPHLRIAVPAAAGEWIVVDSHPFDLPAGAHGLRVEIERGGFDLDWLELTAS